MTVDDLKSLLAAQSIEALSPWAAVRGLLVAPDVFDAICQAFPPTVDTTPAAVSWTITVNKWLPRGAVVPLDADGNPMLKPRPSEA